MRAVAIIGAGELGGVLAHVLARRDTVREIRLVDEAGRAASGKALDIAQAAPVESFSTRISGSTDISTASGADVVVIADRFGGSEWSGEDGLMLVRRLQQMARAAVMICAGASQRELVERGVSELGIPRTQLIGSAPEARASCSTSAKARGSMGSAPEMAKRVSARVNT